MKGAIFMPKNKLIVKEVDFFGDMLKTARDELGIVWAGVTWLCDGIGLSDGQVKAERKFKITRYKCFCQIHMPYQDN